MSKRTNEMRVSVMAETIKSAKSIEDVMKAAADQFAGYVVGFDRAAFYRSCGRIAMADQYEERMREAFGPKE